jgi:hypothetical protein
MTGLSSICIAFDRVAHEGGGRVSREWQKLRLILELAKLRLRKR